MSNQKFPYEKSAHFLGTYKQLRDLNGDGQAALPYGAQHSLSMVAILTRALSLRLKMSASFTVISKSFSGQQITGFCM